MLSYEEGAMIILRYEPDDRFGAHTPQSFIARPVKRAVFTPHSFGITTKKGESYLYVAKVERIPGKVTRLRLTYL